MRGKCDFVTGLCFVRDAKTMGRNIRSDCLFVRHLKVTVPGGSWPDTRTRKSVTVTETQL